MTPVVAHFTFNLSTYSGAARQALALARQLEGIESVIFNVERERHAVARAHVDGVEVIHLPARLSRALPRVLCQAVLRRVEIVHLHGLVGVGLLAGLLLRRRIVLKTTLFGSDDFDSLRRRKGGAWIVRLARRVDLNVALSDAIAEVQSRYLPAERIWRVPNGVALAADAAAKTAPVFCVVGLVCERKRTHEAIEVFLRAYSSEPDARLYVVGPEAGDFALQEADARYAARCRAMVPEAQRAKVVFTGPLDASALQAIYRDALGFFCFSASEGMPNALLEAMSANCVPIVGPIGGVAREIISDAGVGFVIDRGAALPSLDELRVVSRARGPRARIETHYAIEHVARRYAERYRALLA